MLSTNLLLSKFFHFLQVLLFLFLNGFVCFLFKKFPNPSQISDTIIGNNFSNLMSILVLQQLGLHGYGLDSENSILLLHIFNQILLHLSFDGSSVIEMVVQKFHMQSFGHQIIQYFVLGFESAMHEHGEQIDFEIVHAIQHDDSDPDGIKCPEVIVAGTGHGDQTELAEGQKKQVVGDPYAQVSYQQYAHYKTQASHEHYICEVFKSIILNQNITFANHLFQNALHYLNHLYRTSILADEILAASGGVRDGHLLNRHPQNVLPNYERHDQYTHIEPHVDEELVQWDLNYLTLVNIVGREEVCLEHIQCQLYYNTESLWAAAVSISPRKNRTRRLSWAKLKISSTNRRVVQVLGALFKRTQLLRINANISPSGPILKYKLPLCSSPSLEMIFNVLTNAYKFLYSFYCIISFKRDPNSFLKGSINVIIIHNGIDLQTDFSIYNLIKISNTPMQINQLTKGANKLQQKERAIPFDTEMSQQPHAHDKELAPWVRQKTRAHHEYSEQQISYHKFLANVRLSPKHKGRLRNQYNEPQCLDLDMIKADLTNKINAQKISNNKYYDEKQTFKINQCKTFLQRKTNLSKLYKRPKSIQLSLDCQPISLISCTPLSNPRNSNTPFIVERKKKDNNFILTLKKRKQKLTNDGKISQTIDCFKPNILIAQKKMYQTLQFNTNSPYKNLSSENQRQSKQLRTNSLATKSKSNKQKQYKIDRENQEELTCQGISATAIMNKTCRQKTKNKVEFANKIHRSQFFVL